MDGVDFGRSPRDDSTNLRAGSSHAGDLPAMAATVRETYDIRRRPLSGSGEHNVVRAGSDLYGRCIGL